MADKLKMARFGSEQGKAIFEALSTYYAIIAPVEKPGRGMFSDAGAVAYEQVRSFDEIEFFKKTCFSAKSVLFPVRQALFTFQDNRLEQADDHVRPTIIFLRSCDVHGIEILDAHFLGGAYADFYYERRRGKIKLFLLECENPFENCSCVGFQANKTDNWSAFMRKTKDGYEVQIKDEQLKDCFPHNAENILGPRFVEQDPRPVNIPQNIDVSIFEDDIWKEYTSRCIACGRCTLSCPTCGCFTVQDVSREDKNGGERTRIWSSCLVKKFSRLAGDHDFRVNQGDRLRYRVLHKIYDFTKRYGINMCVGCGRCDDACPEYISMLKCIEKINHVIEARQANGQRIFT